MKRLFTLIVCLLVFAGCSKSITVDKDDALEVCIDAAGLTQAEVKNTEVTEKDGFTVEFDSKNGHYTYTVGNDGIIKNRKYEATDTTSKEDSSEENTEDSTEESTETSEKSEAEETALQAALANSSVTQDDVENVSVSTNSDATITVQFTIKGGNTIVCQADAQGTLVSSVVQG